MATAFDIFTGALAKAAGTDGVLGDERVISPPDPAYGYHCTPTNALTFGSMGVDGVHYAILTIDGEVRDESPVLEVSPMDGDCYQVLAPSFLDYLAAGCGVTTAAMADVLAREERGEAVLVTFLRERFSQRRLWPKGGDEHRFDDLLSFVRAPAG
ncbi:MAG TPA: hypothetical protein VH370_25895 [Humisphaera sp.]|jgi:hypothetical protein|nr:hypothetical protein [Humisphaera sp.]